MSHNLQILGLSLLLAIMQFSLRGLPFLMEKWVGKLGKYPAISSYLPASIMLILVFFESKDLPWRTFPYGVPVLLALACLTIVHLWRRNMILSIVVGTSVYAILSTYAK